MTEIDFQRRFIELSAAQDKAAEMIFPALERALIDSIKLCEGTALSRFYLKHRLSYDLDFFVPEGIGFDAQDLASRIARVAKISNLELTHDSVKADQLHFFVMVDGMTPIKISFVEDMYANAYPRILSGLTVSGREVATESVEGLYYRKLRTVVGWASDTAEVPQGGRQTAQDMFDLYTLSKKVRPLRGFIEDLTHVFPVAAFEHGLAAMPWYEIAPELAETVAAPEWEQGKDVEMLQAHLYRELGMVAVPQEELDESSDHSEKLTSRKWRP